MKDDVRGLYTIKDMKNIKNLCMIEDRVIITDIRGLIELYYFQTPIVCNKFIVLDSVELTYNLNALYDAGQWFGFRADYSIPLTQYLKNVNCSECLFLMPPSNIKNFEIKYDLPHHVFFKRINPKVLLSQRVSDNKKLFVRRDTPGGSFDSLHKVYDVIEYENEMDMFNYGGLVYHRRNRIGKHEQFGRLVFEFVMLGKFVYFFDDPFEVEDGLSDYLKYYKIKFENNAIITKPSELIERMKEKYEVEPWI
jgi:hypothetical protein